jgi:hypothetical protein
MKLNCYNLNVKQSGSRQQKSVIKLKYHYHGRQYYHPENLRYHGGYYG